MVYFAMVRRRDVVMRSTWPWYGAFLVTYVDTDLEKKYQGNAKNNNDKGKGRGRAAAMLSGSCLVFPSSSVAQLVLPCPMIAPLCPTPPANGSHLDTY